jgi:hypothetical protein
MELGRIFGGNLLAYEPSPKLGFPRSSHCLVLQRRASGLMICS